MRSSVDIQFSVCLIRIIPEPSFPSQGSQARGTRLTHVMKYFGYFFDVTAAIRTQTLFSRPRFKKLYFFGMFELKYLWKYLSVAGKTYIIRIVSPRPIFEDKMVIVTYALKKWLKFKAIK